MAPATARVMSYDVDTRVAYRDASRAARYKAHQTRELSWARFATWHEQRQLGRILRSLALPAGAVVLDAPCGTGIAGAKLAAFPVKIIACDISAEMMALARREYAPSQLIGFVQADITALPLRASGIRCALTLGFMHRVPAQVRRRTLAALAASGATCAVVSYSVDDPFQRLKRRLLTLRRGYSAAPCAVPLSDALAECRAAGWRIADYVRVAPPFSSEFLLVLVRQPGA